VVVFDGEHPVRPLVDTPSGRSVRVLTNTRTPGLAGTRNTGILASDTDLVAFCDDDDEWVPGKLRRQVELLRATPDADVVVTGMAVVRDGRAVARIPSRDRIDHHGLLRSRVQEVHPSSILARRPAVVGGSIGLVDEAIPGSYGEDYEWLLRASAANAIPVVREPLVRVHWHRSSYFADRWATIVDAIGYLIAKHPDLRTDRTGLARLYGRLAFASAAAGRRAEARSWARRTIALDPRERRAYVALVLATGIVSADTVLRLANRTGRGI
jgi:glycosyltransferase involved in cell wall biosynthesis